MNKRITNMVGGNMKNVEEYAKDYAKKYAKEYAKDKINENNEKIIINLKNKGFTINEIINLTETSKDFVEKTLNEL
jgi:DNA invertase Pin-like site-specific DNA recombinase